MLLGALEMVVSSVNNHLDDVGALRLLALVPIVLMLSVLCCWWVHQ